MGSFSLLQGIFPIQGSNPGLLHCRQILPAGEPRSPILQADSLPAEPLGKPKNIGLDSLSLLQWIFLTQELGQLGTPALQADSLPTELPGKGIFDAGTSQEEKIIIKNPQDCSNAALGHKIEKR